MAAAAIPPWEPENAGLGPERQGSEDSECQNSLRVGGKRDIAGAAAGVCSGNCRLRLVDRGVGGLGLC